MNAAAMATTKTTVILPDLYDGLFTVLSPNGGHRTFRVRTQPEDAAFMPGAQLVGILAGSDNTWGSSDYITLGDGKKLVSQGKPWNKFVNSDHGKSVAVFVALALNNQIGQKFAQMGYTLTESRKCFKCGKDLTDPASQELGIGPTCRKK